MNTTARAGAVRRPLRATTFIIAAAIFGTGLLLAGCSGSPAGSAASAAAAGKHVASAGTFGSAAGASGAVRAAPTAAIPAEPAAGQAAVTRAARLVPNTQDIIFIASLTVQAKNVTAAATQAAALAQAAGGYASSESESLPPGKHSLAVVSLQLKIPVAQYNVTLGKLSALGTRTSLSQQAQDVTQQVADVGSRVTSAQAAITQLRALLSRAGSISSLLGVQDQINAQESSLEALLAQQRALGHETTFATVSLRLVSHHPKAVKGKKKRPREHGFAAGFSAGWRALRLVVSGLLTGIGAVLPFALIAAAAGGIAYGGRKIARRRSRPTAAQ
jgi:hypothetical protein